MNANTLADRLDKAKVQLTMRHPFIASLLLRRELCVTEDVTTASIDRRGQIRVNPTFADQQTDRQLQFLLAHECMHHAFSHTLRRGARDPQLWNQAGDAVINETLIQSGIGEFIPGGVRMPGAENLSSEEVYARLQQDPDQAQASGRGTGIGDDLDESGEPMDAAERDEAIAEAQRELVEAVSAAKMAGSLPAGIARLVKEALVSHTPWHDILADYMQTFVNAGYSWSRPNRRFICQNIYLPGHGREPVMGPVVMAIDTSGSVTAQDLAYYQGHVQAIVERCQPERVVVLYCDTKVQGRDEFGPDEEVTFTHMQGGGGTSFVPVFETVDAEGINPDLLVYFTDLYGAFPDAAPGYPTVWVTDNGQQAPFGKTVRYRKNS
ncbi:MAG: VWA-like domain-containing protein [Gammaproteobacteria bacterium SHHR-1]